MDFRNRTRRDDVGLELTPLIDVMFLLLIFLLVTASFTRNQNSALPVDLPMGSTGQQLPEDAKISVIVQSDRSISLTIPTKGTEKSLSLDEFHDILVDLPEDWRGVPLHLRGDTTVAYGRVMEILDLARKEGFQRVFNVIQSTGK